MSRLAAALGLLATAQSVLSLDPSRTYQEWVEMRDGVKLHTRMLFPRDHPEGKKYTAIVDRSPYGYMALELLADIFVPWGFVSVGQDMRGTGFSGGDFTIWHSDANDSYDLGLWILQQEWSNGDVYSIGASADGLAEFTMVMNAPEWLHAQYYIWASSIGYEVVFPQGAYLQALADMWIRSTVPDQADECLQIVYQNEMPNPWWDALNLTGNYYKAHAAAAFWAGWYDIFAMGNIVAYEKWITEASLADDAFVAILIDPLGHCQDAAIYFPQDLILGRTAVSVMQAFQVYGIRDVVRPIDAVTFYVMSSDDEAGLAAANYWTTLPAFPKFMSTNFYIHGDGSSSTSLPQSSEPASTSFIHDPSNPIASNGGNNLNIECGPLDQSIFDERSDVLTFTTEVFTEEFVMTGPMFAHLFVSTNATDTDFMVKITDLFPSGEARLLFDSGIRMRWREGGSEPVWCEDGEVYEVSISLWNTSYVVAPGHALRFYIQSSNTPRFHVNKNNGVLLYNDMMGEGEPVIAQNTIYHSAQYPSRIILPKVTKAQLPEAHVIKAFEENFPDLDLAELSIKYDQLAEQIVKKWKV